MIGGGVFLGVAVLDLMPHVLEGFHDFEEKHNVALGPILMLCGYSILLFIEKVLFKHSHAFHHHRRSRLGMRPLVKTAGNFADRMTSATTATDCVTARVERVTDCVTARVDRVTIRRSAALGFSRAAGT